MTKHTLSLLLIISSVIIISSTSSPSCNDECLLSKLGFHSKTQQQTIILNSYNANSNTFTDTALIWSKPSAYFSKSFIHELTKSKSLYPNDATLRDVLYSKYIQSNNLKLALQINELDDTDNIHSFTPSILSHLLSTYHIDEIIISSSSYISNNNDKYTKHRRKNRVLLQGGCGQSDEELKFDILNQHTYDEYDWFLVAFTIATFGCICMCFGWCGNKKYISGKIVDDKDIESLATPISPSKSKSQRYSFNGFNIFGEAMHRDMSRMSSVGQYNDVENLMSRSTPTMLPTSEMPLHHHPQISDIELSPIMAGMPMMTSEDKNKSAQSQSRSSGNGKMLNHMNHMEMLAEHQRYSEQITEQLPYEPPINTINGTPIPVPSQTSQTNTPIQPISVDMTPRRTILGGQIMLATTPTHSHYDLQTQDTYYNEYGEPVPAPIAVQQPEIYQQEIYDESILEQLPPELLQNSQFFELEDGNVVQVVSIPADIPIAAAALQPQPQQTYDTPIPHQPQPPPPVDIPQLYETQSGNIVEVVPQPTALSLIQEQHQQQPPINSLMPMKLMDNPDQQQKPNIPLIAIPSKDSAIVPKYKENFGTAGILSPQTTGIQSPDSAEPSESHISLDFSIASGTTPNVNYTPNDGELVRSNSNPYRTANNGMIPPSLENANSIGSSIPIHEDLEMEDFELSQQSTVSAGSSISDQPAPPPGPPPNIQQQNAQNQSVPLGLDVIVEGSEDEEMMSPESIKAEKIKGYEITSEMMKDEIQKAEIQHDDIQKAK